MPPPRPLAFAKALELADIRPQCSSCGAPEKFPQTTVVLNDGEELGRCEACDGWLDQPVVPGEPREASVQLAERSAAVRGAELISVVICEVRCPARKVIARGLTHPLGIVSIPARHVLRAIPRGSPASV